MNRLHIEGVAQHKGKPFLPTQVCEPVPRNHAFDPDTHVFTIRGNQAEKGRGRGRQIFVHQFGAVLVENTDVPGTRSVDRCRKSVYGGACKNSSRCPPVEWIGGTAILPLQHAAKEAWMSINPRHRIAALLRIGKSRMASFGRLAVSGTVRPRQGDW